MIAHIKKEDMPRPILGNPELILEGIGINLKLQRNPDYYEFFAEIYRVTGQKHVIMHEPGDPDF